MRFFGFSIRRLLLLTGLVAVLLYLALIRPVAVAKQFVLAKRQAAFEHLANHKFADEIDKASVEAEMEPRTWKDIAKCQQRFALVVHFERTADNRSWIAYFDNCATPFGVRNSDPDLFAVKDKR